jgi:hypothetical protein
MRSAQGTAIGAGNMVFFRAFTWSLCPLMIFFVLCSWLAAFEEVRRAQGGDGDV